MKNSAVEFLCSSVSTFGDRVCVMDESMALTFEEFFIRAFLLHEVLRSIAGFNRPVAVYLPKSALAVISFAGILLSGNFYVPLEIKSPRQRLIGILKNIDPCWIVTSKCYEDDVRELRIHGERVIYLEECREKEPRLSLGEMIKTTRDSTSKIIDMDPCYVMHTSGSTGTPKGVVIPHRGVVDYIDWAISCLGVDQNEVIGNQAPFFFDNSTLDIYLSWATGAKLVLIPEKHFIFPAKLMNFLEQERITFVFFVPSVLVNIAKLRLLKPGRLADLKKVVFAGEVMPTKHLASWQRAFPHITYVNLYGPTEITVDCTYFIVDRVYEESENLPIGYPCNNTGILILNGSNESAAVGEYGELCVRGSSLALGYWNAPEKSNEVFVQNPLQKNYCDRIYRTGDIVYVNEYGQIIFVGRKDDQIKHMGHRIELGEIETAVRALPDIDNCCALYDEKKGEINVFCEGEGRRPLGEMMRDLSQILPTYMVPRKVHYMKALPLTPNGKVNRKALAREFV